MIKSDRNMYLQVSRTENIIATYYNMLINVSSCIKYTHKNIIAVSAEIYKTHYIDKYTYLYTVNKRQIQTMQIHLTCRYVTYTYIISFRIIYLLDI